LGELAETGRFCRRFFVRKGRTEPNPVKIIIRVFLCLNGFFCFEPAGGEGAWSVQPDKIEKSSVL
jgi:hypothetical protein